MDSHNQQGHQKRNGIRKNNKKKIKKIPNSEKVKEEDVITRTKSQSQWFNDLSWTDATLDDPFSVICGSSHGGFLSLEEIDEDVYNLEQKDSVPAKKIGSLSKKRKHTAEKNDEGSDPVPALKGDSKQGSILKSAKKKNNKKKKKKKKAITDKNEISNISERGQDAANAQMSVLKVPDNVSAKYCEDELSIDTQEISAWKELRIHPLLEKAISALQFKEPTAIQKLCIPAAAHQGKVCDHLRAAAKFTNIRVVPIVGGIAAQKQERLLKKRPHVIVGTPGRLWELG